MGDPHRHDLIEHLVRESVPAGFRVEAGSLWLVVTPEPCPLPKHGWKLHVSTRVSAFPALVGKLVPVLVAEGCVFKLARSQHVLQQLNDGSTFPASVGKAFAIYPDQGRVRELGLRLAEILRGHQGPRILSDRQISRSAPVYYRYSLFSAQWAPDAQGRMETRVGPPGEDDDFDSAATLSYRQPGWATDPFTGETGEREPRRGPVLLAGRYRVTAGIRESARGNVYRAIDEHSGATVVLKQARALVAEYGERNDTRLRIRNERRVLQALTGLPGVPQFIDHFRLGDDEFLVATDCGTHTLTDDVRQHGPFPRGPGAGPRSLDQLGAQLARILTAAHGRGVIVRDISPQNIVLDGGKPSIVDFGLSAFEGLHLPGRTPGYAPARQVRDEPPQDSDDFHALGMTLLFASRGVHPVSFGQDPDLSRIRALQALDYDCSGAPDRVLTAVAGLLSGDDERARAAARHLASGKTGRKPPPAAALPAAPVLTPELAAEVTASLLSDLIASAEAILRAPDESHTARDLSIYSGAAGIGLELLQHLDREPVRDRVSDLAEFAARASGRASLPPGLFTGVTGVHMFLQEARDRGLEAGPCPGTSVPPQEWEPGGHDLIAGAAGAGLGHLSFYRATSEPAHLDAAWQCARALIDPATGEARFTVSPDASHAVEPSLGRAHGLAGAVPFLLSFGALTGDTLMLGAAAQQARRLAAATDSLIRLARGPATPPLALSWCQGLTGIGQALLHAQAILQDPSLGELAREAAAAGVASLPRLTAPGQCCGITGLGNFLIDLAIAEQDERWWEAAHRAGIHLLLRSAGPPGHPLFTDTESPEGLDGSWAAGAAGLLGFFRRLARHGGADSIPLAPGHPSRQLPPDSTEFTLS
jgi:serine/threonine protein kinase